MIFMRLLPARAFVSSTIGTSEIEMPQKTIFIAISTMHSNPARSTNPGPVAALQLFQGAGFIEPKK